MVHIGNEWDQLLADEFKKDYYQKLRRFLAYEYAHQRVYPDMYDIFNALKYTPYHQVKAVILGQDPYHGKGQAHGLCFSVQRGVTPALPSLQNIFAELHRDVGFQIPDHGNLEKWARQGVLMLNTVLTVRESQPNSHANKGWEILTDQIVRLLDALPSPVVRLPAVGKGQRQGQAGSAEQPGASDPDHLPPQPVFRELRVCRLRPLFQDQRLSAGASGRSDRLADLNATSRESAQRSLLVSFR